jgi:polysaccharide export outer membrane protein
MNISFRKGLIVPALFLLTTALTSYPTFAQSNRPDEIVAPNKESITVNKQASKIYSSYVIGPGDIVRVEVLDIPELSGTFSIGPDGIIYLPRLRGLYVENLTIEELRFFITDQLREFVLQPEVFVSPIHYRPVRVYVGGEVARPGFYTISKDQNMEDMSFNGNQSRQIKLVGNDEPLEQEIKWPNKNQQTTAPTLFDALQAARGVTPFSQLEDVQVTRKRPKSQGGGKVRATVNFLTFISSGDEDVNIRLYDGDSIFVQKSEVVLRDQLLAASRTNLSPDFVEVFVSGRVKEPGPQQLPQGASLNQAIASAGGPKLLRGKVEFLRFNQEGSTDRRTFRYSPKSASGNFQNPVLMPGDVVRVTESIVSASVEILNEITAPVVGVYSVYSIYRDFQ